MTTSAITVIPPDQTGPDMVMQHGTTMYRGEMVADCEIHVVSQRELPDATHVMEVEIRRHDGTTYGAMIDAKTLEDERALNALGSAVARANWFFRSKTGSLAALKACLHAQPGNDHVVVDVAQAGWNSMYSCWFGESGMVDALGNWSPWSSNGVRASCRDAVRHSYRMRTFNLRREAFGPDLPILERPTVSTGNTYQIKRDALMRQRDGAMPVEMQTTERVPCAATDDALSRAREHMQAVMALWHRNTGNYVGAIGIGYATAAATRHHAERAERLFPHLYITGRTQFGKDTMARILALATGMNPNAVTSGGRGTTEKSIRNKLSTVGNVPLWLNELRSDNSEQLLTLVRTSSDFQSNSITDTKQRVITFTANRPMMLVGEVLIGKDAEHSRYVVVRLNKPAADKKVLRQLEMLAGRSGSHWSQFLCDHNRAAWQTAIAAEKLRGEFLARGCDSRRARGWSLVAAGIAYWFDSDFHLDPVNTIPKEILDELYERATDAMLFSVDDGVNAEFWSLCQSIRASGDLSNAGSSRWARSLVDRDSNRVMVAIWVPHLLRNVSKNAPKECPGRGLVQNELRADPGYVGNRNVRVGGEPRQCMLFDREMTMLPRWVIDVSKETHAGDDASVDEEPVEPPAVAAQNALY